MANPEHLQRLTTSVEDWNHWRDNNPTTTPNLTGADLGGADLRRADLGGANLTRADLTRADLSRADLFGAVLTRANLPYTNLRGANLSYANLSYANLRRADLFGAVLTRANLDRTEGFDPFSIDPAPTREVLAVLRLRVDTGGALSPADTRDYVDRLMSVVELIEALMPAFTEPSTPRSDSSGSVAVRTGSDPLPAMVVQRLTYENPLEVIMAIGTVGTTALGVLKYEQNIRNFVDWFQDRNVRTKERKARDLEADMRIREAERGLQPIELPAEAAQTFGWALERNVDIESIPLPQ